LNTPLSAQRLKDRAVALGFNLIGLTPAAPSPHLLAYLRWLEAGQHAEMDYMERPDRVARRRDLRVILPSVRSLVIAGLDYHTLHIPPQALDDPGRGRIAAYAWGQDYHRLMLPRLKELAEWMRAESRVEAQSRAYVDTGAVLERSHAQQAGLGFTGKNTMLIHPRRGSDFFLGEVLTEAEFDRYDQPQREGLCGRCTRCLNACPTQAFPQAYVLDANRCISYLTIEHRGWIERDLREKLGNWVFGCDICQAVCPWQRFAVETRESAFFPIDLDRAAPPLEQLLGLTPAGFGSRYGGSALERAGRDQLVRNACLAAANGEQTDLAPLLAGLLDDASPIVRGHAAWALGKVAGQGAREAIRMRLELEKDAGARKDIDETLAQL
jgi:epoxyqueuosine reductase